MGDGHAAEPGPAGAKGQGPAQGKEGAGAQGLSPWVWFPLGISDLPLPVGTSAQPPRPLARRCVSAMGWWMPWSPISTMPWTWASARTR